MPYKAKHAKINLEYKAVEQEIMKKAAEKKKHEKRKIFMDIVFETIDDYLEWGNEDREKKSIELIDNLIKKYELKLKKIKIL